MQQNTGVKKVLPFAIGGAVLVGGVAAAVYNKLSGGKLTQAIRAIWNNIIPFFQTIGTAMKGLGKMIFSFFATIVTGLKNDGAAFVRAIQSAVSNTGVFFQWIGKGLGKLLVGTKQVLISIGKFLGTTVSAIARGIQNAWTAFVPYAKAAWVGFKDLMTRGWALLKFGAHAAWEKTAPLLARAWEATKLFFKWLGVQIKAGVQRAIPVIKDLAARAWVVLKELVKKFVALMRTPAGLSGAAIIGGAGLFINGVKSPKSVKGIFNMVIGAGLVVGGAFFLGMKVQSGLAFVPII